MPTLVTMVSKNENVHDMLTINTKIDPERMGGTDAYVREYETEVKEIQKNLDGSGRRTEVIQAFWPAQTTEDPNAPEDGPYWLFRAEDVSSMFIQTFGVNWHLRIYTYDAWKDVLDALKEVESRRPQRVMLDLRYEWREHGDNKRLQVAVYFEDVRVEPMSLDFLLEDVDIESGAK